MKHETLASIISDGKARARSKLHKRALEIAGKVGIAPDMGMHPMVAEGFDASAYKAAAAPLTSWRPSRPQVRNAAPRPPRPSTYGSSRPASPSRPPGGNGRTAVNSRPQFSDRSRRRP